MRAVVDTSDFDEKMQAFLSQTLPGAVQNAVEKACLKVEGDAKRGCPADDGQLRASITHKVTQEGGRVVGVVGTNLEYGVYVHQGTGLYAAEGNGRKDVPWYVPVDRLSPGARAKMHIIKIKGREFAVTSGIRPRPFLQEAADRNRPAILKFFERMFENNAT